MLTKRIEITFSKRNIGFDMVAKDMLKRLIFLNALMEYFVTRFNTNWTRKEGHETLLKIFI